MNKIKRKQKKPPPLDGTCIHQGHEKIQTSALLVPPAVPPTPQLRFTQDWSGELRRGIRRAFGRRKLRRQMTCVEIGSFEGRGTRFIVERLCQHKNSRLICIDPWEDCYVKGNDAFRDEDHFFTGQYARFAHNTTDIGAKLTIMRGYSQDQIPKLDDNSINFVFIDGDHSAKQVFLDAKLLLPKMKPNAIILFDDYLWVHESSGEKCGDGIDRFLHEFRDHLHVEFKGRCVIARVVG
jgi:hypothetical protein